MPQMSQWRGSMERTHAHRFSDFLHTRRAVYISMKGHNLNTRRRGIRATARPAFLWV